MPFTNDGIESTRSDGDAHDHHLDPNDHLDIDPLSPTPSGVATPRPDPVDKRLPSIMHSYFGQVGARSTTCAVTTPACDMGIENYPPTHHRQYEGPDVALPTAPSSPDRHAHRNEGQHLSTLPYVRLDSTGLERMPGNLGLSSLPTPPTSSPSFPAQQDSEEQTSTSSIPPLKSNSIAERPTLGRQQSATDVIPLRTRRHTAGLKSLSGIITPSSVYAAHLFNPTSTRSSTTPNTPTHDKPQITAFSSLASSYIGLAKLTSSVTASSRLKSTPPHTPRAHSNEAAESSSTSTARNSGSNRTGSGENGTSNLPHQENLRTNGSSVHTPPTNPSPVAPPKGKLSVKVSRARGLRPSYDPYFVCAFEWNEYISHGPKHDGIDGETGGSKSKEDGIGSVPIKRLGSDTGKPMAIPMKSRQSSTTSLNDQRNFKAGKQVTDPEWVDEATL